jgi:hypothetical protein
MGSIERFYTTVESCLGGGTPPGWLARDEAERTVKVVLDALATDELVVCVASALQIDEETAARRIECVTLALRELLSPRECSVEDLAP